MMSTCAGRPARQSAAKSSVMRSASATRCSRTAVSTSPTGGSGSMPCCSSAVTSSGARSAPIKTTGSGLSACSI